MVQGSNAVEPSDDPCPITCTTQVPTPLSPIIGGDTPTFSPTSGARPTLRPSDNYPSSEGHRTFKDIHIEDVPAESYPASRGYFTEPPRSFSRASRAPSRSSFRNSLGGAEQAAARGLVGFRQFAAYSRPASPGSASSIRNPRFADDGDSEDGASCTFGGVVAPSRSASPTSVRSVQPGTSYLEPEDTARRRLRTLSFAPQPSIIHRRPEGHKSHSMVDLRQSSPYYLTGPSSRQRTPRRASPSSQRRSRDSSKSRTPYSLDRTLTPSGNAPVPDGHPAHSSAQPYSSSQQHPRIKPCTTISRWDRNVTIKKEKTSKHVIQSLTMQYTYENLPENWTRAAHPEGALYWIHKERPIFTDAYLCDTSILHEIDRFLDEIDHMIDSEDIELPDDYELVLELSKDETTGGRLWEYYFVDHSNITLFWLHQFDPEDVVGNIDVVSAAHIHHELQSFYYAHWEVFPLNREVPPELFDELVGILIHAGVDSLTCSVSTSIYSEEELHKLLKFVKSLKSIGGNFGHAACVVGRLMSFFAHARFLNYYGQECARLNQNQTVYDAKPQNRSSLMVISAFLFFAPDVHLKGLESLYTDEIICQHRWVKFIGKLQGEWEEFVLYATVLLNANVAFLAIPSVDPNSNSDSFVKNRTPPQIASYLSVIASVGSIITGLLLIRQHRNKKDAAEDVGAFLKSRMHLTRGFETLAIMYSLPYSLLMWAMISFLAAFSLECVINSSEIYALVPVVLAWTMTGALVLWCITTGWERENPLTWADLFFRVLKRKFWDRTSAEATKPRGPVVEATNSKLISKLYRILPRRKSREAEQLKTITVAGLTSGLEIAESGSGGYT